MTYEEAKTFQKQLNEKVEAAEVSLKEFEQYKGAMGLIPDHIRETPEYQKAKNEFNRAFDALRTFNKWYVKQFKKEIQKQQRELVKSRYKRAN